MPCTTPPSPHDQPVRPIPSAFASRPGAGTSGPSLQGVAHDPHDTRLRDGGCFHIAPATAADAQGLLTLLLQASPSDIRLRFFHQMRVFRPELVAAMLLDDDNLHIALVARVDGEGPDQIAATAMLVGTPGHAEAEFALLVRHDAAHRGLGRHLLECLLDEARRRGFHCVYGLVLRENALMLQLAREMNAGIRLDVEDPSCQRVEWLLGERC